VSIPEVGTGAVALVVPRQEVEPGPNREDAPVDLELHRERLEGPAGRTEVNERIATPRRDHAGAGATRP
jgi:hypothetical protein